MNFPQRNYLILHCLIVKVDSFICVLLEDRRSKIPLQVVCLVVLTNGYQTTQPRSRTRSGIASYMNWWRTWNFQGYWRNNFRKFQGQLKKKWNFNGCSRKTQVEFPSWQRAWPWVLVFDIHLELSINLDP